MIRLTSWLNYLSQYLPTKKLEITLTRGSSTNHGTHSLLCVDGLVFHSLELPWRDNKSDISCIPNGTYNCIWHKSPKFGWVYRLLKVPGRNNILIHAGNWAGDVNKGFKSNSKGCILLGSSKGEDAMGQSTVWKSGRALKLFYEYTNKRPFKLIIKN